MATNVAAITALYEALASLRSELEDTKRATTQVQVEAVGAATRQPEGRSVRSSLDILTVVIAVGFFMLVLSVALVGTVLRRP
jgi:hypothetical protein